MLLMFSSNVFFEEFFRRSLRASPLTNPSLTLGGWLEKKMRVLKGFSRREMCFNICSIITFLIHKPFIFSFITLLIRALSSVFHMMKISSPIFSF